MDRMQTEASDTTDFAARVNDALSKEMRRTLCTLILIRL